MPTPDSNPLTDISGGTAEMQARYLSAQIDADAEAAASWRVVAEAYEAWMVDGHDDDEGAVFEAVRREYER